MPRTGVTAVMNIWCRGCLILTHAIVAVNIVGTLDCIGSASSGIRSITAYNFFHFSSAESLKIFRIKIRIKGLLYRKTRLGNKAACINKVHAPLLFGQKYFCALLQHVF